MQSLFRLWLFQLPTKVKSKDVSPSIFRHIKRKESSQQHFLIFHSPLRPAFVLNSVGMASRHWILLLVKPSVYSRSSVCMSCGAVFSCHRAGELSL